MNFWDTSAFVAAQDALSPGHARALGLLRQKTKHAASELILAECASALTRRLKPDRAASEAAWRQVSERLSFFSLMAVDRAVIDAAIELARAHALRGADSVHLASALLLSRETGRHGFVFVTGDREQATAARKRGLRVVVP